MITNEVQYRVTKADLEQFEEAATNLDAKLGKTKPSKLERLQLDAVRAQADDLRTEIEEYERA